MAVIKAINDHAVPAVDQPESILSTSRKLSELILWHEVVYAPTSVAGVKLWWNEGLFGSYALRLGRLDLFAEWASNVEPLIGANRAEVVSLANVTEYLSQARLLKTSSLKARYYQALADVEEMVRGLDPERDGANTQSRKNFRTLLQLSAITRLLSAGRSACSLKSAAENVEFLSRGSHRAIALSSHTDDVTLVLRDGVFVSVLNAMLDGLEESRMSAIQFSATFDSVTNILTLRLGPIETEYAENLLAFWRNDLLWAFFLEELPIRAFSRTRGASESIVVHFSPLPNARCRLVSSTRTMAQSISTRTRRQKWRHGCCMT